MLELDVVEFVLEFRVLGARSRLKNTMTLLKKRFIKIKIWLLIWYNMILFFFFHS